MEPGFSCRSREKVLRATTETSEMVVLFYWTEYSKLKFVVHLLKPIFDTSFGLSRPFFSKRN